jgi:hypothetical protein
MLLLDNILLKNMQDFIVRDRQASLLRSAQAKGNMMQTQLQMMVNELEIMSDMQQMISLG